MTVEERLQIRPYRADDEAAVLDLIAADRLPGQPPVTADSLTMALAGTGSTSQAGARAWWAELDTPQTVVATGADGDPVGVCSFALRVGDASGQILWFHAGEDLEVATPLLEHTSSALGPGRTLYAFTCGPAWRLAADGLPVRRRPATHRAFAQAGFTRMGEESYWQCHNRDLARPDQGHRPRAQLVPFSDPPGWRLELTDTSGDPKAHALLGAPYGGVGVLWWLHVEPAARGRGIGRTLLQQSLEEFTACGATEVIALIDQDPPGSTGPDPAAAPLLRGAGFGEIDTLYSYHRRP